MWKEFQGENRASIGSASRKLKSHFLQTVGVGESEEEGVLMYNGFRDSGTTVSFYHKNCFGIYETTNCVYFRTSRDTEDNSHHKGPRNSL